MVKKIESKAEFEAIINSGEVALIDFYADWCGPCKQISPVFERLEGEHGKEGVKFYQINVDDLGEVAEECEIRAMPTFQVYHNGKRVDATVGAHPGKLTALVVAGAGLV